MFSKNDSNQSSKENKTGDNGSGSLPQINMVSEGTVIKGSLSSNSDVRVAGKVDGEASSEGKFILASSGIIDGDIKAKDADVAGTVEGELTATNKLILRQSAVVKGDIHTKVLLVEEGARFDGACKMTNGQDTEGKADEAATASKASFGGGRKGQKEEPSTGQPKKEK